MSNIEIGIDLGTTNSEIVVYSKGQYVTVKNTYGDEFTPSVFGVNKSKTEEVGKKPYERYFKDASNDEVLNNKPEVKRLMGTDDTVFFPRINKSYNAEEISSKILNYLKQEAVRRYPDLNTNGAVITIPAHFSTVQAEATKRAGQLAGFNYVVLLQEPIAAAMSYGFGKNINENWLVYDLGGGTFDAAIISSQDGMLKVLSHNGDNFLGGKDIDNLIVEKIILPVLKNKYGLNNFSRNQKEHQTAFAKLKYAAEQAKIQLSSVNETNIEIDIDVNGENIYENILLTRNALENVLSELIEKTIVACEKTILGAGIKKEAISKIVFVGASTQLPFIKTRLETKFSIPVDTSSDPLTAVARGACIFASSQIIPNEYNKSAIISDADYHIELNNESLTQSTDELITGSVKGISDNNDYYISIQSKDNTYNSGKIKLENNTFVANVVVRENTSNEYWLYLYDNNGNVLKSDVNDFSIMHGLSVEGAPIPYSIGVGVSKMDFINNKEYDVMDIFFKKDSKLPLEETRTYKTKKTINIGDRENVLPITVYEGEDSNPEYNTFICEIALTGDMVGGYLYEGSDIDITIKVDTSRTVTLSAYIPELDKSFDIRSTTYDEKLDVSKLEKLVKSEETKINEVSKHCSQDENDEIRKEIEEIKNLLQNASSDEDDKRKASAQIKSLQSKVNKIKENTNKDEIVEKFNELSVIIKEMLNDLNNNSFEKRSIEDSLEIILKDGEEAIKNNDYSMLSRINEQLIDIQGRILVSNIEVWKIWFSEIINAPQVKNNPSCTQYIQRGITACNTNNQAMLMECVQRLVSFLPREKQNNVFSSISGITK